MATNEGDVHFRAVWDRPAAGADRDSLQDDLTGEVFSAYFNVAGVLGLLGLLATIAVILLLARTLIHA
jgi:hypothetical protein